MNGHLSYVMPHEQWFDAEGERSIVVTFRAAGETDEFALRFVEPELDERWDDAPRVRLTIRSDSWGVFRHLPELFAVLGSGDTRLDRVKSAFDRLGAEDATVREGNGPYAPALAAAREFVRLASPANAAAAAEALNVFAEYEEEPPF